MALSVPKLLNTASKTSRLFPRGAHSLLLEELDQYFLLHPRLSKRSCLRSATRLSNHTLPRPPNASNAAPQKHPIESAAPKPVLQTPAKKVSPPRHHQRDVSNCAGRELLLPVSELENADIIYATAASLGHDDEGHPECALRVPAIMAALGKAELDAQVRSQVRFFFCHFTFFSRFLAPSASPSEEGLPIWSAQIGCLSLFIALIAVMR